MTRLDISDGFDVHDYRSKLKLLRQDAGSMSLENRAELGCPACGTPFDRLFVSDDETVTFDSAPSGPICLARTDERLLVLTH
ncbi:DUF7385 family protein [Halobaculum limi]|uniref:DUF7385 family protein n=1 Tax=Halobaculum limi TaxID=3031916 RepID=UPI002404FD5C|nr:flagella cluster protein [Halobaculum sp. YSMS11]